MARDGPRAAADAILDPAALGRLDALIGGNPDIFNELVTSFLTDAPALVTAMDHALQHKDAQALRQAAHTLKSNSADFGARELSDLCRRLEEMGKEGRLSEAAPLVKDVHEIFPAVEGALESLPARSTR